MTKDELKEMIDNTINENGRGQITGKTLNLALNEVVESMGTGSGSSKRLYINFASTDLPDEELVSNAALYEEIMTAVETDTEPPALIMLYGGDEVQANIYLKSIGVGTLFIDSQIHVVALFNVGDTLMIYLSPDGTTSFENISPALLTNLSDNG